MKKEIKVADLDYPINLGETKTPNLEEWFCKCDVIQNMFESGKASVFEIKQDSGFVKRVVTSLSDEQKKLCKKSSLCGPLIEKMQTGAYAYKFLISRLYDLCKRYNKILISQINIIISFFIFV